MKNSDLMKYAKNENYPVEVLRFKVDPTDVQDFLDVDHDVWTVMECDMEGLETCPFLYKEVWLDNNNPGAVIIVMVWETQELWNQVGATEFQKKLCDEFDKRFAKPYEFLGGLSGSEILGIVRYSRFEK